MPKSKKSNLVGKPKIKINWKAFQNDPEEYEFIKTILKFIKKFTGMGIAELASKYKKGEIGRDHVKLASLNVFLAVYAGKAAGEHLEKEGKRKSVRGKNFLEIKEDAASGGDKMTDKTAEAQAEKMSLKHRKAEARALEKKEIYMNVMHRINKLLDVLESASHALQAEWGRTNS
jgi:hypothetical protein